LTRPRALLTLRSMGVRFVIRSAEGKPLANELSYGFEQARIVIGRGAGADVRIPHLTVSEVHAVVRLDAEGYGIIDEGSTNGTRVNGVRLTAGRRKRLADGDRIEVGVYALTFHAGVALAQTITAERTAELARRLFRQSQRGAAVSAPRLVVLDGPRAGLHLDIPPPPARLLIGRDAHCQLALADPEVLPEHAEAIPDLDGVLLRATVDGGLSINGHRVTERRLRGGDEVVLGATRLQFEEPAEEPIENLGAEPDKPLPPDEPEPQPSVPVEDASPPPPPRMRPPRPRGFDADVIIYTLAAVVIAISAAALIALMTAD
jgi:pSer/pThr/pTyr-binding forkhead associated (FHA) protein